MKHFRFIPDSTNIHFVKWRYIAISLSIIMIIISCILPFTWGINFGIDFKGGLLVQAAPPVGSNLTPQSIRKDFLKLNIKGVQVQSFGEGDIMVRLGQNDIAQLVKQASPSQNGEKSIVKDPQDVALAKIKDILGPGFQYKRTDSIGPQISHELIIHGIEAVLAAVVLMLFYVWFRFEWQFGIGAVLALFHDVFLTIGVFSLGHFEFGLPTIAAILTVVGYSMNDTVVVFDRIRENLRKYKKMSLKDLVDLSINETLSRTLMTSSTTLLSLLALLIFGGDLLRGFVFAMFFGVIVGTYSSIFIASPVLIAFGLPRRK